MRISQRWLRLLIVPLFWCGALIPATHTTFSIAQAIATPVAVPVPATGASAAKENEKTTVSSANGGKLSADEKTKKKAIALILPLSSKSLNRAAEAMRDGFIAASEVSGKDQFAHQIHLTDDDGASLANAYRKAVSEGAIAVVAGITREGANVVAREAGYVPTLALNTPSDASRLDANNFYHISLSLEHDAKLIARNVAQEGLRRAALVTATQGNVALSRRVADAFEKEWVRLGGSVVMKVAASGDMQDASKLKTTFDKAIESANKSLDKLGDKAADKPLDKASAPIEFVFIAADMNTARGIRPYIPQGLPVYATAHTLDPRAGALENLDLDTLRYLEMPWFAERDHIAVVSYPRPQEALSADYERLYALGIDAWRIMMALLSQDANDIADVKTSAEAASKAAPVARPFKPIDGVTGRITLEGSQFTRGLTQLELRDGRPQLIKSAE